MPDHLLLPPPRRLESRRASGGGGGGPSRNRAQHGRDLRTQLARVVAAPRRIAQGVDPNLVFKIRAASRPSDSGFEGRNLVILGESVNYTYFVMAEDEGSGLARSLGSYSANGVLSSFFDVVDDIEPYGPEDRRGVGVRDLSSFVNTVVVDVGIWPSEDHVEAVRRARIVEAVLTASRGRVLLRSVSARRNYLRVEVDCSGLQDLLEVSVVETVRTPPVPFLDFREWRNVALEELDLAVAPSAEVGVLDDMPATGHPLLSGLVSSVESLAPAGYQWQSAGQHGTEVVGRVLYPNLDMELRDLRQITALGTVRVVRILEPDPHRQDAPPQFASYGFPHEIVGQAIRHLHSTYGVRIFNLSVGYAEPFDALHVGPLTEIIDDLVRELNIVVVVPTGNTSTTRDGRTNSGHHVILDKPEYFYSPEHRLSEPGPAALAVTVGSTALSSAPADLPHRLGWQTISMQDELSCFSRTGPGIGTTQRRINKPDLIDYGGNLVMNDTGHILSNDPGAGVVVPSFRVGNGALFASVIGTSFAAPAVSRVAADIAHAYPESSANLIRALLASGAAHTGPASAITEAHLRTGLYGNGRPSSRRSIESGARRTTMTYDGSMPIDTVQIHPLPVPEAFRRGSRRERSITVALAFDPPVRRQRREYLAGSMKVDIYRDIDPDLLAEMLIRQDPDDPQDLIGDRRRLKLTPGSNSFTNSTVQVRQWSPRRAFTDDDETFFVVVTHKAQTWARSSPTYVRQSYALAVTLEDQNLVQADLRQLLTQQVRMPARVRVRP